MTTQIRVETLSKAEMEKISFLTPAERKQALIRAAEEKAKEVFKGE